MGVSRCVEGMGAVIARWCRCIMDGVLAIDRRGCENRRRGEVGEVIYMQRGGIACDTRETPFIACDWGGFSDICGGGRVSGEVSDVKGWAIVDCW